MATIKASGGIAVATARRRREDAEAYPPERYVQSYIEDVLTLTRDARGGKDVFGRILARTIFPAYRWKHAPNESRQSTGYRIFAIMPADVDDPIGTFHRFAGKYGYGELIEYRTAEDVDG